VTGEWEIECCSLQKEIIIDIERKKLRYVEKEATTDLRRSKGLFLEIYVFVLWILTQCSYPQFYRPFGYTTLSIVRAKRSTAVVVVLYERDCGKLL
jgi:hypothetical protein